MVEFTTNVLSVMVLVEVMKIKNFEDMHGFRFATLELRLIDYPQQLPFETKVVLDTLHSNTTAMTTEENKKLYDSVRLDYEDIVSKGYENVLPMPFSIKELNYQIEQVYIKQLQSDGKAVQLSTVLSPMIIQTIPFNPYIKEALKSPTQRKVLLTFFFGFSDFLGQMKKFSKEQILLGNFPEPDNS